MIIRSCYVHEANSALPGVHGQCRITSRLGPGL